MNSKIQKIFATINKMCLNQKRKLINDIIINGKNNKKHQKIKLKNINVINRINQISEKTHYNWKKIIVIIQFTKFLPIF